MGKTKTAAIEDKKAETHMSGMKGGQRLKTISMDEAIAKKTSEDKEAVKAKKAKIRGKKYLEAKTKIDKSRFYTLKDAVTLARETSTTSFVPSLDLHLVVKKDGLSANVTLPHSSGKSKKVATVTAAVIDALKKGKVDFDVLLATPEDMGKITPFAKILGPKGLMPNPKNGTLIKSKEDAKHFSADSLTIKTEKKAPLMHVSVGKLSLKDSELMDNAKAIINAISERQIVKAYLTTSMGPSIKLEVAKS